MEDVYLEVEVEQIITLYNQTLLETDFEWLEVGSDREISRAWCLLLKKDTC
jgi:hypothetical protein